MVAWSENRQKLFDLYLAPKFPTCRPFESLHFPWILNGYYKETRNLIVRLTNFFYTMFPKEKSPVSAVVYIIFFLI